MCTKSPQTSRKTQPLTQHIHNPILLHEHPTTEHSKMPKNASHNSSTSSTPSAKSQRRARQEEAQNASDTAHPVGVPEAMAEHVSAIQRMAPTLSMIPTDTTALAFPPLINEDGTLPTAEQILRHQEAFHERVRAEMQQAHERMAQEMEAVSRKVQQQRAAGGSGLLKNSNDGEAHFYSSDTLIRSDGEGNVVRRTIVNRDGEVEERVDTINDGKRLLDDDKLLLKEKK